MASRLESSSGKRKRPRRFLCNPAIRAQEALENSKATAFEGTLYVKIKRLVNTSKRNLFFKVCSLVSSWRTRMMSLMRTYLQRHQKWKRGAPPAMHYKSVGEEHHLAPDLSLCKPLDTSFHQRRCRRWQTGSSLLLLSFFEKQERSPFSTGVLILKG